MKAYEHHFLAQVRILLPHHMWEDSHLLACYQQALAVWEPDCTLESAYEDHISWTVALMWGCIFYASEDIADVDIADVLLIPHGLRDIHHVSGLQWKAHLSYRYGSAI